MKKLVKILVWLAGIVVALLLVAVLLLALFFPLDKARAMAVEKGSEAMGRTLEVADVELSFWGGLGVILKDLSVGNPKGFSSENFLVAEAVDVKLQLMPLISGDMMIDRLIITRPKVNLVILPEGSSNFSFDNLGFEADLDKATREKLEAAPPEAKVAAAVIAFDQLEIIDGQLTFDDKANKSKTTISGLDLSTTLSSSPEASYQASGRIAVGSIQSSAMPDLDGRSLAISYDVGYDLEKDSLAIDKADISTDQVGLSLTGSVTNLSDKLAAKLRIETDELTFETLLGLLSNEQKSSLQGYDLSGHLKIETDLNYLADEGNPQLSYSGTAQLSQVTIQSKVVEGTFVIGRALLDFETDQARLTFDEASFNQKPLKGFLSIKNFDQPTISAELSGSLDLAFIQPLLATELELVLSGLVEFALNISGQIDQPQAMAFVGDLKIIDGQVASAILPEPIKKLDMAVVISSETVRIDQLSIEFEASDMALTGRVDDPFPYLLPLDGINRAKAPRPKAEFHLSATRLDIDRLFPQAVPGSGAIPTEGGGTGEIQLDSVKSFPIPDIDGLGTIAVDTLIYNKIEFSNIKGNLTVKNRKLTVSDAEGNLFGGTVAGETSIDLSDFSDPRYVGKFNAAQIEADDFVSRFSEFGGHLFGKVDLDGSYDARGWEPDAFLNSLTMNSVGSLDEGKLITSGAVQQLLGSLAKQTGETFDKEQPIRKLVTNIMIKDGRVHLDDLKSSLGKVGDISISGSYGFDETIDYRGSILLTEAMSKKLSSQGGLVGGIASFLSGGEGGRIELPIKITGTSTNPSATIDMSALQSKASENLEDKAKGLFKGLFKR